MKNSKNIVYVFILLALSILGVSATAQRQVSRKSNDRQAGVILQRIERRLEQVPQQFECALVRARVDKRILNEIRAFQADFERRYE